MEPTDALTPARTTSDERPSESDAALDALRNPLSVILGRTQLLERRLLKGEGVAPDDHLALLSHIQRSVWAMEKTLRAIHARTRRVPEED